MDFDLSKVGKLVLRIDTLDEIKLIQTLFDIIINLLGGDSIKKDIRINKEIRASQVRLIAEDGTQLGVVSLQEAFERAGGLDLIELSNKEEIPVCKIVDYGKYRFEQRKRQKELKKKQSLIHLKELTMGPSIEENDYSVKLKKGIEFLKEGDRLKLTVRFKGRQIAYREKGFEILKRFQEDLKEYGAVDKAPSMEGKRLILTLQSKKGGA